MALGSLGILILKVSASTELSIEQKTISSERRRAVEQPISSSGFKFNFFDSLLKLASGIIFYLLNLSAMLLFHTYKHC